LFSHERNCNMNDRMNMWQHNLIIFQFHRHHTQKNKIKIWDSAIDFKWWKRLFSLNSWLWLIVIQEKFKTFNIWYIFNNIRIRTNILDWNLIINFKINLLSFWLDNNRFHRKDQTIIGQ
jgi:hypothetical protein